jgi:peptidoglycan hydrolase-like protein with peptidoglycan-binding domain
VTVAAPGKQSRTVTLKYDELVEDIQRELLATGHFQGLVDGVKGPKTRVAIELYQRQNSMDIDGTPTATLLDHIRYTRKLAQASEFTGSVAPPAEVEIEVPQPAKRAKRALQEPQAENPVVDKSILRLQERLARLGYDPGLRSGRLDSETVSAILKFELDKGLEMNGTMSKALIKAMEDAERQLAAQ